MMNWLIASVFFIVLLSLAIQGWMIMTERYGYYKSSEIPPSNGHPEMNDYKAGDKLLVAKFDDYRYNKLSQAAFQKKMEELFSEPSSYEDDDDNCSFK
jgi:hypothetical protein